MSATTVFDRQRLLLRVCTWLFAPVALFSRRLEWVVGPEDVALMATHIARALPRSYTAVHVRHPFYAGVGYDAVIQTDSAALGGRWQTWRRLYGGPVLLAWLVNRAKGFVYVGGEGFLASHHDEREFEFAFLRRRGRRVICYFTGNDIRSPRLMAERAEQTGRPNIGTALLAVDPLFATEAYDRSRRERARVADAYAEAIFTAREDQLSYLRSPTRPFLYFYPDEQFAAETAKFDRLDPLVVVHAPSNPLLKGTDAVRAAMARLTAEHPHVQYRELIGVPHEEVLAALDTAHIALNEFLSSVPGVFGVEAMARRCVLVTSANVRDEPDLGADAEGAWVVADTTDLYERVGALIADPAALAAQASRGWQWARDHASASACASAISDALR